MTQPGGGTRRRYAAIAGAAGVVIAILLAIPGAIDSTINVLGLLRGGDGAPPASPMSTPSTTASVSPSATTTSPAPATTSARPNSPQQTGEAPAPGQSTQSGPPYASSGNGPYPLAPSGYPVSISLNMTSISRAAGGYIVVTLPGISNGEVFRIEIKPPAGNSGFCSGETARCGLWGAQGSVPYDSGDLHTEQPIMPADPTGTWRIYVDLVNREVSLTRTFIVHA